MKPMTPKKTIYISNLVKATQEIHETINAQVRETSALDQSELHAYPWVKALRTRMEKTSQRTDQILKERQGSAAHLPIRSRRAYQWLTFLSSQDNLEAHLHTILQGYRTAQDRGLLQKQGRELFLSLYHMGDFYRIKRDREILHITAHEAFLAAPAPVLEALLKISCAPDHQASQKILKRFAWSEAHASIRAELERLGVPVQVQVQGDHHDLVQAFERVNNRYFQGQIEAPLLTWNQQTTYRKFGHYQYTSDTLMVSRSLDQARVPRYVLDFVMYHELLHKQLGYKLVNGRRYAHTSEFREKEQQFEQYHAAQEYLEALSQTIAP
jgi:hypothetical protein